MDYPTAYRRGSGASAGRLNKRGALAPRPAPPGPPRPLGPAKVIPFPSRLPKLATFGTRQAMARLAARLLLSKALGPLGLLLDLWTLYQAAQPEQAAGWDMTGWTLIERCKPDGQGPYGNGSTGCVNKFIDISNPATPYPGVYVGVNFDYCQFLAAPVNVSGTVHIGQNASVWQRPNGNPTDWPVEVPARPATAPKVGPLKDDVLAPETPRGYLPRQVQRELAEWPQGYQSTEPGKTRYRRGYVGPPGPPRWPDVSIPARHIIWETPLSPKAEPGRKDVFHPPPPNPTKRPPDRKRVRQDKRKTPLWAMLMLGAVGAVTETLDFISALYEALPSHRKKRGRVSFKEKARAVRDAIFANDIDVAATLYEVAWNQIEDAFFGRIGTQQAKSIRNLAEQGLWTSPFGTTVGGSNRRDATSIEGLDLRKLSGEKLEQSPNPVKMLREYLEKKYEFYKR